MLLLDVKYKILKLLYVNYINVFITSKLLKRRRMPQNIQ